MYLILPVHTTDDDVATLSEVFQLYLSPTVVKIMVDAVNLFQSIQRQRLLSVEYDFPECKKAWLTGLEDDWPNCPFSVTGIEGLAPIADLEIFRLRASDENEISFHCCEHGSPAEWFTDAIQVDCSDPRSALIKCNGWVHSPRKRTVVKRGGLP